MADSKITALTSISTSTDPANDPLVIVDVSDTSMAASGTTKKVTLNQLLGASGTATLASATITGDLTVDTSTLKVTASTDTVTVGATTTDAKFRVVDASYNGLRIGFLPGTANYNLYDATVHEFRTANVTPQQLYTLQASSSVWYDGAGGTRMTLNSTGLGVGASPSQKLHLYSNTTPAAIRLQSASPYAYPGDFTVGAGGFGTPSFYIYDNTNSAFRFVLDTSGNVGIGVTPSAWGANYKALQIGVQSCLYNALGYITSLNTNAYENSSGQIVRIANGEGTRYVQAGGSHQWFYAANASAGTVGGFTQAMTLDASGNLLVGTTAAAGSASNSTKTVGGLFSTVNGSTASTASGAAVTMFTSPAEATFMVSAYIFGTGAPASYNAIAIVKASGSTAAITTVSSATGLTISLSGLNVQVTQTSGSPQVIVYSAIRIS